MAKELHKKSKIFNTKIFGFFIACAVILAIFLLDTGTGILKSLEMKIVDINFRLKDYDTTKERGNQGGSQRDPNPKISKDIVIIGIDDKTLEEYGRWPFPRGVHGDLINSFSYVQDQTTRENSIFLDIFFDTNTDEPQEERKLEEAIKNSERVFLETILTRDSNNYGENNERQKVLYDVYGEITNVKNVNDKIDAFYGTTPPLETFGKNVKGYGHANFEQDSDQIYRHQRIVARQSEKKGEIFLKDLTKDYKINPEKFERLTWRDKKGYDHDIPISNMTENELDHLKKTIHANGFKKKKEMDNNGNFIDVNDNEGETGFVLTRYKDHFVPSITLALALEYFNKRPEDIEVVFGEKVIIPNPTVFSIREKKLVPYKLNGKKLNKIEIPINEQGEMLINFMGPRSSVIKELYYTFPVRSYNELIQPDHNEEKETWPERFPNFLNDNKILMVGAFSQGMADDEKNTPFGLMYGIEIHANALNTIIMNNYINELPSIINYIFLIIIVLFITFMTSRLQTGWALLITGLTEVSLFFIPSVLFDNFNIHFENGKPILTVLLTFIAIVVYRVFVEERDKRRVQGMFGKYVSPVVVEKMLETPPQLGGVDVEMTVFFSDIRSFTSLSETMTPQELVTLLNEYLTSMTNCMMDFDGTLDKYIGDAIMGFWGAPLEQEDHAILACRCAIKQLELLEELNKHWPENKQINIGIGLNSGICTVGNMGSEGRMNYTVMGDNVNLASRLEGINKEYKTRIVISEKTYEKIKDANFIVRELDDIRVKGKLEPVRIYELVGIDD